MDQVFTDYLLYYEARMKRRQNDPMYPHSYGSEKSLYDLVASCSSMEELQEKREVFIQLTVKNAIALVIDQETCRKKFYEECSEFVRAKAPAAILEKAEKMKTDMEIVEMVNRVHQQNNIEITVDQLVSFFYSDFIAMENIEVYRQAIIPDEWRNDSNKYAQESMDSGKKLWQETQLPAARDWEPGWTLNYSLLFEDRHRRLIPVNDMEMEQKIAFHKLYKPC